MTDRRDDLVPFPGVGRSFSATLMPRLADAAPSGRVRLDALARWVQDIAHDDVWDAGLYGRSLWVVRRARLRVDAFPRFAEPATLTTFSSGLGPLVAERRTSISTPGGGRVEAAALWVHLDLRGRPAPLDDDERAVYGPSAADRTVKARLRHPAEPPEGATRWPWTFRAAELDLADHINNAAYWTVLEEELARDGDLQGLDADVEFRTPAQPGEHTVLASGARRWLQGADGTVHATYAISEGSGAGA